MDWRKFDLVEYRKGRFRLERQNWSFWDWCLVVFAVALIYRFFGFMLLALGAISVVVVVGGCILFLVSRVGRRP